MVKKYLSVCKPVLFSKRTVFHSLNHGLEEKNRFRLAHHYLTVSNFYKTTQVETLELTKVKTLIFYLFLLESQNDLVNRMISPIYRTLLVFKTMT